jgi:hypothetical protein
LAGFISQILIKKAKIGRKKIDPTLRTCFHWQVGFVGIHQSMASYELLTPYIDVWMDHRTVRAVLTSRAVRTNKKLRLQEEHGVDGLSD